MSQSEKNSIPSSFEDTPHPDNQHRIASMRELALVFAGLMSVAGMGLVLMFGQTETWHSFGLAGLLWATSAIFLVVRWLGKAQPERAAYVMIGCYIVLFPLCELLWSGATPVFIVMVIFVNSVIALVCLPRNRMILGVAAGLLSAGLTLLASNVELFPRSDNGTINFWGGTTFEIVAGILLILLWLTIRGLQVGTIRTRLLIAFVTIVVLTGFVIASTSVVFSFQNGQRQVIAQLESVATLKTAQVNSWLQSLQLDLQVELARDTGIGRIPVVLGQPGTLTFQNAYDGLLAQFQQLLELRETFEELYLLDLNGQVVLSTDTVQVGKIYKNQPFFQEGLKQPYIQPPTYLVSLRQNAVIFTRPVVDQKGQVLGVFAGRASLEKLGAIMRDRAGLGETGETYLVASNQALLTGSHFPGYAPGQTYVRSVGATQALKDQADGHGLYEDYRGVAVVGVYRWLPELGVALLAEQDQTEAFQSTYTTLAINAGVSVGAVVFAIIIGLLVTRSIASPLQNLANTVRQIASGDLKLTIPVNRRDEIGDLARAFYSMTVQLRDLIATLEDRVRARTHALEIQADVSRQISGFLNIDELLRFVVSQVQTQFGYYHVHIYLVDERTQELLIEAANSADHQHPLMVGQGIVGAVVRNNQLFVSNNVDNTPNFVRDPLLPNTQSELAVPLRKGNQVLGVLDIQSEQTDRFTSDDINLMQSLADQIAIALDNARLVSETQRALHEVERLNRQLTREQWEEFKDTIETAGYYYKNGQTIPVEREADTWLAPMKYAAKTRQLVKQTQAGNGEGNQSELAIPLILRDEVIGVLGVKRDNVPVWAEEEVAAVEAVADQVARALENARLSKEQEKTIEQLKEVDRLKSEFLTSMSHELRTPLNSIIGFADVMLQGIDGDLPDLAMNDIKLIYNSGQHLLALINDVLDLSKIEAERMELILEEVNLAETMRDVLSASSSLVKDKSIEIKTDTVDGLPPVWADKLRLNQILLNLVSNAAKFTHAGSITIKARVSETEPDKMRVSVIDTGIGIPLDKQETIFDRFRQADSSTTRKYGGTGLGLAICKKLVELHGGQVGVISHVDEGSEFYFTIPLVPGTVAA